MGKKKVAFKPSTLGLTAEVSSDSEASTVEVPKVTAQIERKLDNPGNFYEIEGTDMNDKMGISGMAITAHTSTEFRQLISIAIQSWILQAVMLWLLYREVHRHCRDLDEGDKGPDWTNIKTYILLVALVLHFVNCFGDIPFAINILLRIHHFHDTVAELCMGGPCFFIDGIVTPTTQLILGGLFICTSPTTVDVLLNSCAVAFISHIDNWILGLGFNMKSLAGEDSSCTVHIPYSKGVSRFMQWSVCVFPITPLLFSVGTMCWAHNLGLLIHDNAVHHHHHGATGL